MRIARPGEELTAPGVLRNPAPVEALYDRNSAHAATLRNLLHRRGYRDIEHVRGEGRVAGLRIASRERIMTEQIPGVIEAWVTVAKTVTRAEDILG